jgi:hypothetical protein
MECYLATQRYADADLWNWNMVALEKVLMSMIGQK